MSTPTNPYRTSRLTVAIIARDAEHLLAQTLDCVAQRVDEVIVLDTGSTDQTGEVAREKGATLIEQPWDESFALARNQCLRHASGDWILWLDAGETLTTEAVNTLLTFVKTEANAARAYVLFVEVPQDDGTTLPERVGRVRLVPRRRGIAFEGRVNERLDGSLKMLNITTQPLDIIVRRPACDADEHIIQAKAERNLRLADLELAEGADTARVWLAAGSAHAQVGHSDRAADCFRRAIQRGEPGTSDVLDAYYGLLNIQDDQSAESEVQIAICLQALEAFPIDAQLLCGMGSYMLRQNRLDLAARAFRVAAEYGQTDPCTWHIVDIQQNAATCLSLTLQLQGDDREAEKVLVAALDRQPRAERLRHQLLQLYIKQANGTAAMATFDLLPAETPHREALRSAVRGGLLAVEKNWSAAAPYLQAAYSAGCRDPICLRYLVATHHQTGDHQAAEAVLREWQSLEPLNPDVASPLASVTGQPVPSSNGTTNVRPARIDAAESAFRSDTVLGTTTAGGPTPHTPSTPV